MYTYVRELTADSQNPTRDHVKMREFLPGSALWTDVSVGRKMHSMEMMYSTSAKAPVHRPGSTDPEQLFAQAFAACLSQSLHVVALREGNRDLEPDVTAHVDLLKDDNEAYSLQVHLEVCLPSLTQEQGERLLDEATQIWPWADGAGERTEITIALKPEEPEISSGRVPGTIAGCDASRNSAWHLLAFLGKRISSEEILMLALVFAFLSTAYACDVNQAYLNAIENLRQELEREESGSTAICHPGSRNNSGLIEKIENNSPVLVEGWLAPYFTADAHCTLVRADGWRNYWNYTIYIDPEACEARW